MLLYVNGKENIQSAFITQWFSTCSRSTWISLFYPHHPPLSGGASMKCRRFFFWNRTVLITHSVRRGPWSGADCLTK